MKRALLLLAAAAAVVAAGGWALAATWHLSYGRGLFCALGTATTVGCDAEASTAAGRIASAGVMLVTIPLLAAVFARLTGHHAGRRAAEGAREHVAAAEKRIAAAADERHDAMKKQLAAHCADIMRHVSAVADGPGRGGPGSNPGSEGLPAETAAAPPVAGPVVPPPATAGQAQPSPVSRKLRDPKGAS